MPLPAALNRNALPPLPTGIIAMADGTLYAECKEVVGWALAAIAAAEQRATLLQQRVEQLETLSITDELTGLLNRRGFEAEMSRALAGAARSGKSAALLICDLDGFKAVNDNHGHAAGDELLRQVARLLYNMVRRTDCVARLGGDEFAILLIDTAEAGAAHKAASLQSHLAQSIFMIEHQPLSIGASIGSTIFAGQEDGTEIFQHADRRMYAAKASRRRDPSRSERPDAALGRGARSIPAQATTVIAPNALSASSARTPSLRRGRGSKRHGISLAPSKAEIA